MSPLAPESVLDVLSGLIDKSLVVYEEQPDGTGRYRLLETVRQYARERLAEAGEDAATGAGHAARFLGLAEQAEPCLMGAEGAAWLARLETEHDNLRAALAWCLGRPEGAADSLRLVAALWRFWMVRGHLAEGLQWLGRALEQSRHEGDSAVLAAALNGAGSLAFAQGDYAGAGTLYEEGLVIRRLLGDEHGIASSLVSLGVLAYRQGDYAGARDLYGEGLVIFRLLGDEHGTASSLGNLGLVAHEQGDYAGARDLYREGLTLGQQSGDRRVVSFSLDGLAAAASGQGRHARAARLLGAAQTLREAIGSPLNPQERAEVDRRIDLVRETLSEDAFANAWAEGWAMTWEQAAEYALADKVEAE